MILKIILVRSMPFFFDIITSRTVLRLILKTGKNPIFKQIFWKYSYLILFSDTSSESLDDIGLMEPDDEVPEMFDIELPAEHSVS